MSTATVAHALIQKPHRNREGTASALGALRYAIGDTKAAYIEDNGQGGVRFRNPGKVDVPVWIKDDVKTNAEYARISLKIAAETGLVQFCDTWLAGRWDRLLMSLFSGAFDHRDVEVKAAASFIWERAEAVFGAWIGNGLGGMVYYYEHRHWNETLRPEDVFQVEALYLKAWESSRFMKGEDLAVAIRTMMSLGAEKPKRRIEIDMSAFDGFAPKEQKAAEELRQLDMFDSVTEQKPKIKFNLDDEIEPKNQENGLVTESFNVKQFNVKAFD